MLLGSEIGIFSWSENSKWNRVQTNFRIGGIDTSALRIRLITQISSRSWIAASESRGLLSSFDSGNTFTSRGAIPIWCISTVGAAYTTGNYKSSWDSKIVGGPRGVQMAYRDDDVGGGFGTEIDTSIQNVAACLDILDTLGGRHNYITIFATLGEGIFVRNNGEASQKPYNKEFAYSREGRVGVQHLPGRQIWTLKSFLVTP